MKQSKIMLLSVIIILVFIIVSATIIFQLQKPAGKFPSPITVVEGEFKGEIYIPGIEGVVAKYDDRNDKLYFYTKDHLGSNRIMTKSNGDIEWESDYYAFGSEFNPSIGNDYKFTGKELDSESGLYYYGARYYDSDVGRFTQVDILKGDLANPQSLNRYSYTLNNPLKYIDPSGNQPSPIGEVTITRDYIVTTPADSVRAVMSTGYKFHDASDSVIYNEPGKADTTYIPTEKGKAQLTYTHTLPVYDPTTWSLWGGELSKETLRFYPDIDISATDDYTVEWRQSFDYRPNEPQSLNEISTLAFPNPFNQKITLKYTTPEGEHAELGIYNVLGQKIKTFENLPSGRGSVEWHGKTKKGQQVSSGVYFFIFKVGEQTQIVKVILVK